MLTTTPSDLKNSDDMAFDPNFYNPSEIVCSCISFFYAFPAFYTVIRLGVLLWRGKLPGSFYKLLFIFGVNDLFSYVIQMITIRLSFWGILSFYEHISIGFVPTFLYFTMNASSYIRVIGCVLMAANRASSVFIPHSYERLWQTYGWFLILGTTIPIQYLNYDFFIYGVRYYKVGPAVYIISEVDNHTESGFENCLVCSIGSLIALVLNVYTGFSLHHHMKLRNRAVSLMDVKFFYICLVLFICQILWTLKQVIVHYSTPLGPWQRFAFTVGPTVTDLQALFPIYSILILSKEIRAHVVPWKTKPNQTTPLTTLSSQCEVPTRTTRNTLMPRVSEF